MTILEFIIDNKWIVIVSLILLLGTLYKFSGIITPSDELRSKYGLKEDVVGLKDADVGLKDADVGLKDADVGLKDAFFRKDQIKDNPLDSYHVLKGMVPVKLLDIEKDAKDFSWDHSNTCIEKKIPLFIWCDGVWGSVTFTDNIEINHTDEFIVAPACTTYIKKSDSNKGFESVDYVFEKLGFGKKE
jgi:hypothetical protein